MTIEEALSILRASPTDGEAWEFLVAEVYQPLLAYVAVLLLTFRAASVEAADDIVQDVMLAFFRRWPIIRARLSSIDEIRAYLRTSCRNRLIDRYRHDLHARQLLDFLALKFSGAFQDEATIYRKIFVDEIIGQLSEECAVLLKQYVEEDLSLAEIADRVQASPAAFYARWYRCLHRARQIFARGSGSGDL